MNMYNSQQAEDARGPERASSVPEQAISINESLNGPTISREAEYLAASPDASFRQLYRSNPYERYLPTTPDARDIFLRASYGEQFDSISDTLEALGASAHSLIADPGVVTHLSEFKEFFHTHENAALLSSQELRYEFAKSLGTEVLYRGRAMTDSEFESFQREGGSLNPRKWGEPIPTSASDYMSILALHANPIHEASGHIQSATRFPDNALSMGTGILKDDAKQVYLFTLEVPKIDIIDINKHPLSWDTFGSTIRASVDSLPLSDEMKEGFVYGPHKVVGIEAPGGDITYRSVEHGSELFIFGPLSKEHISKLQCIPSTLVPEHTEPVWNPIERVNIKAISNHQTPEWLTRPLADIPDTRGANRI
jgi:hypothetical protein